MISFLIFLVAWKRQEDCRPTFASPFRQVVASCRFPTLVAGKPVGNAMIWREFLQDSPLPFLSPALPCLNVSPSPSSQAASSSPFSRLPHLSRRHGVLGDQGICSGSPGRIQGAMQGELKPTWGYQRCTESGEICKSMRRILIERTQTRSSTKGW